jgi:MOSC domain-containing protein YiiM
VTAETKLVARVAAIYLRPSSRTPARQVTAAEAVAGQGLLGDHARGGSRGVTLLEKERWQAACRDLGREDLAPSGRRANLLVEDFPLAAAIGRRIRVGECLIDVVGELRPCKLMEDVAPGLMEALSPDCRGGAYGRVVQSGRIETGAPLELLSQSPSPPGAPPGDPR